MMRSTLSSRVITYRVISGSVTVRNSPFSPWCLNSGMMLPLLSSTLPYLTARNLVDGLTAMAWLVTILSETALHMPYTLTGAQALSVETNRTSLMGMEDSRSQTASTTFCVPTRLVRTASDGLSSQVSTCFSAAAMMMV